MLAESSPECDSARPTAVLGIVQPPSLYSCPHTEMSFFCNFHQSLHCLITQTASQINAVLWFILSVDCHVTIFSLQKQDNENYVENKVGLCLCVHFMVLPT